MLFSNEKNDQINSDIIQVKLNVSKNMLDGREWIAYKSGNEITNEKFWMLLDNWENVKYWQTANRNKYIQPLKSSLYIFLYVSIMSLKTKKVVTIEDDFGEYQRTIYEDYSDRYFITSNRVNLQITEISWLLLPLAIYEMNKWLKPLKDPVSFYDIKPLVDEYNNQITNLSKRYKN